MKRDSLLTVLVDATKTLAARDDTTTDLPAMPTLTDPNAYTTPSVSVPPNSNNPFIIRQHNPSGTVFIAVGSIVGAILLGFILYHLIVSCSASRLAKKTSAHDRGLYEKYQNNNSNAYGFANMTPQSTLNNFTNEYTNHHGTSISKLPLLNNRSYNNVGAGSQFGDNSTIYQSDMANATTKYDLTKMFISPTAEVMQHKRVKSFNTPSLTNLPFGGSNSNLGNPSPATNRHSQLVPNLYINNEINNSEYLINQQQMGLNDQNSQMNQQNQTPPQQKQQQQQQQQRNQPNGRKTIPSMYLEDLID
ncbi:hypothetical protein KGF54_004616 [Candida jiufengensis]|uniref:uncharacterized protein n=1 Tax=Candida jiufengensis TaxID=497108 RepID=UPI00222460CA|nr:uncharacterized protein KGF54_004616 [Candida jiufengensis]KAI5951542.1 hypothetical protein KGF54_004616 [Candida jiufengensis]